MVFLCKCCTRTHTHTQTFASVCVFAHTQISIIKLYVVSFRRAKPEIQIRDPNRDRAVLLLTRQNKYGDKVAHTGAKTKARINIYKYVKKEGMATKWRKEIQWRLLKHCEGRIFYVTYLYHCQLISQRRRRRWRQRVASSEE